MNFQEIQKRVKKELLSRNLANPSLRLNALEKVSLYIQQKHKEIYDDAKLLNSIDRNDFKAEYETYKGSKINGAESSVINEIYNQLD